MTNLEKIQRMDSYEMARFIVIDRPICNELCEDANLGCAFKCKFHQGIDIIEDWLDEEVFNEE